MEFRKKANMTKLFTAVLLSSVLPYSSHALTVGSNVSTPTIEEIVDFYIESDISSGKVHTDSYITSPYLSVPYEIGTLSTESLNYALNTVNYLRFIAGITDPLTLNSSFTQSSQAAALGNGINDLLTHFPTQPSDMSNTFYQMIQTGATSSSMAQITGSGSSSQNLYNLITTQWMKDSDQYNIDRVAHRRWILNPTMTQTGFGVVSNHSNTYGAMYFMDGARESSRTTGVAWPAQLMPVDLFDTETPWSFSVGEEVGPVTVTLTRDSDQEEWFFETNDGDKDGHFFIVENSPYGQTGCIIFRPDPSTISYEAGDVFHVLIEGATNAQYSVAFFDVESYLNDDEYQVPPVEEPTTPDINNNSNVDNNTSSNKGDSADDTTSNDTTSDDTTSDDTTSDDTTSDDTTSDDTTSDDANSDDTTSDDTTSDDTTSDDTTSDDTTSDDTTSDDTTSNNNNDSDITTDDEAENSDNTDTSTDENLDVETEYSFTLAFSSLTLHQGKTQAIFVSDIDADSLQWTSSEESVATVTQEGMVTALDGGKTIITATHESGYNQTCEVFVLDNNTEEEDVTPPLEESPTLPDMNFIDVDSSHWFYSMVETVYFKGLMSGASEEEFSPFEPASRGMITTILYSLQGKPENVGDNIFDDVGEEDYFYLPVTWARTQEIVLGATETLFDPHAPITREQLATILYNYNQQYPTISDQISQDISYTDQDSISSWAEQAVAWCQSQQLMTGREDGCFDPQATATRCEIATILSQYIS